MDSKVNAKTLPEPVWTGSNDDRSEVGPSGKNRYGKTHREKTSGPLVLEFSSKLRVATFKLKIGRLVSGTASPATTTLDNFYRLAIIDASLKPNSILKVAVIVLVFIPPMKFSPLIASLLFFASAIASGLSAPNISPDQIWSEDQLVPIAKKGKRSVTNTRQHKTFALNMGKMKAALLKTKPIRAGAVGPSTIISLPMADGTFERFTVEESSIMEPPLAAKFPLIKTYAGRGLDHPTSSVRISVTPRGFHAQILNSEGASYVDPYDYVDPDYCISYRKDQLGSDSGAFRCLTLDAQAPAAQQKTSSDTIAVSSSAPAIANAPASSFSSGTYFRVFRVAIAATAQYTQFHSTNSGHSVNVADGLAGIVVTVNRVTGIYERELAIRLLLVGNNDQLVFTSASSDPYVEGGSSAAANAMCSANQTTIDNVIGNANYDIGHLFAVNASSQAGASPYGTIGHVCIAGWKAQGVTGRGLNAGGPIGDPYDVDYVAHEMGHQFGGHHSFNSQTGACGGGTRDNNFAYEPGSGTSIMAYAGICADSSNNDNTQNNSDPFFHFISLENIINYVTTGTGYGDCASTSLTGNSIPSVSTFSHYYIPKATPFRLTATGSDADGDTLSYSWEERDLGPAQLLSDSDNGSSPLFRSYAATSNPVRTFPRFANQGTNTARGEKLPTVAREMFFRVTARDQRPIGAFATADTSLTIVNNTGPFAVSSPNSSVTVWPSGTYQTVTLVGW
jgi:hypothetical protein